MRKSRMFILLVRLNVPHGRSHVMAEWESLYFRAPGVSVVSRRSFPRM